MQICLYLFSNTEHQGGFSIYWGAIQSHFTYSRSKYSITFMSHRLNWMSQNLILAFAVNVELGKKTKPRMVEMLAEICRGALHGCLCRPAFLTSSIFGSGSKNVTRTVKVPPMFVLLLTKVRTQGRIPDRRRCYKAPCQSSCRGEAPCCVLPPDPPSHQMESTR